VALRIVVLLKAVPVVGTERLDSSKRVDRSTNLEPNGNDEYCLEKSLQLTEAHAGDVTVISMGPPGALDAIRKALAMGAARAVHVTDPAIAGSDLQASARILAAAVGRTEHDLVLAGFDSSDGAAGVIPSMLAMLLGLPYLSNAADIEPAGEGRVRVRRLSATGYDVIEAPTPALVMGTQLLGAPRYPSLRGIMQARAKEVETLDLAALGIDPATVGEGSAGTKVLDAKAPPPRGAGTVVREAPDEAVEKIVAFLAERGLS
jgi:electron transfer flavoprotein beta subunit